MYRAKQALSQCSKEKKLISFILFDVDNFKNFNDSYGHDAEDRILQDLSKRIHQLLDSHDLFGRYGGDEFAILLTGLDEQESVKNLEQMKVLIGEAELTGIPEKYFISMGIINLVPDKQTKLENLYVSCDKALYEAKGKGKNCIISGKLKEMQLQY
ncbi:GGDEF domain-containing protein [Butyricicoccus sp. 1XD8-22]|nr:GGDEF domain-containing protein [Butyricicoccus sp. 1XD8-22]